MTEFKIGDVVVLKSGSERMTIADEASREAPYKHAYTCVWMDRNGTTHREIYESDILKLYTPPTLGRTLRR